MTIMTHKNTDTLKGLLLFNIFDVDSFVLKVSNNLKNSNYDFENKVERKYYEVELGKFGYEKQITEKEYNLSLGIDSMGVETNCIYYSTLNYEDFKDAFPIEILEDCYNDELLYNESGIINSIFNSIDNIGLDSTKKTYLKDLVAYLNNSNESLSKIKFYWFENTPLNEIQKKVILIHQGLNDIIINNITYRYEEIFPNIFRKKEATEDNLTYNPYPKVFKDGIIYNNFKEYTDKYILDPYMDYSYLFHRLLKEEMIHRLKHKDFMNWLYKEEFIKERVKEKFLDKMSFTTHNYKAERENNFNIMFGL